jgi:hypothetical protein
MLPVREVGIPSVTMFIRTTGDPLAALPAVRTAVRRIEPDAVFHGARTLLDVAAESAAATRLASRLLGGFAAIALLLAAIGVYGVMSYSVRRRSRELGTRLALGASPADLTRLVLRQASLIALVGLAVGTAATLILARALSSLLRSACRRGTPWRWRRRPRCSRWRRWRPVICPPAARRSGPGFDPGVGLESPGPSDKERGGSPSALQCRLS